MTKKNPKFQKFSVEKSEIVRRNLMANIRSLNRQNSKGWQLLHYDVPEKTKTSVLKVSTYITHPTELAAILAIMSVSTF